MPILRGLGVAMLLLLRPLVGADQAGTFLTIHNESLNIPVVSLADPSRDDPYEFRFVVVNSKASVGEWAIVVDRDEARVLVCMGRLTSREGLAGLSECVEACPLVLAKPQKGKR